MLRTLARPADLASPEQSTAAAAAGPVAHRRVNRPTKRHRRPLACYPHGCSVLPRCDRAASTLPQNRGLSVVELRGPSRCFALQFVSFRSSAPRVVLVETAGIEPASAVAQKVVSTSVSGALISSPVRHAGGVAGDQLRKVVLGVGRSGPIRASLLVDPGGSAAGELETRSAHGLVTKRRARTHESPHLLFSRVFYEASRDLDSQPPPRTDHVEACRPRGVLLCLCRV